MQGLEEGSAVVVSGLHQYQDAMKAIGGAGKLMIMHQHQEACAKRAAVRRCAPICCR